ncbi:unnamed protein product [Rotaria sp. Silwood1]|nr:unnamed protein product [Rotaria sp. Silwood1]
MLSTTNSDPEPIERQKTFATTETYLIDSETTETVNQQTCADLLMEADRIFDIFREEVNSICKQWHEFPISQLVQLFPDSNYVDDDLRMLEPLLNDQNIVHIVKGILDYWKSYSHIRNICSGGIRFLNHISVLPNDLAPTLTSMLETTKDTPGKCWLKACQNFHKAYPQYNTSPSFFLIAQYGLSNELIDFVHRLSVNDVNALREVVNDWDESLVSTKTILDFALIKTFLDRIYAQAQSSREENSTTHFGFDEVIHCFEIVLNEIEFQNIQQCFEICSKSLLSIQRIHQDIADREQSKRQRIIGIMKQSSLYFVYQSIMLYDSIEHQFDVNIDDQSMVFGELIELHDRARLIEYSNNKMTNNSEEELDLLRSFIGFVDLIEEILKRFLSLHVSGHLFVSEYLSSPEKFTCTEKNYQQLINFSVKLDGYLNEWDDYVCMIFRFGQVAVHVPNNVPIYIELDASFHLIPEQEKLIILNSLHRENIDQIDWKKLNLEKMPGISLVANYLQSIKNSTIILQDLNEQNMKPIDLDTCSSLLEQYFVRDKDGKNIAWTKLFIFIAVYSHLFSGFSRCGYFLVSSVKWLNVPQLRMDILISLLNSSDQFTSLSVENVRQNQRSTNTSNLVDFTHYNKWFECTISLLVSSQRFYRDFEDASSVSLRDIARFCRLYNWYFNMIQARAKAKENKNGTQENDLRDASLMALLLCYYFRLKSPKDRQAYVDIIHEQLGRYSSQLKSQRTFLLDLIDKEQKTMIDAMELPPDTATNRALKDNIFVLVACIVNRIPVILCGKPGCSKTSSVQIVINNLKGTRSKSSYFHTLPELIAVSYQGSQNCTSESVIKVFQRAEKYTKVKSNTNQLLPVIVFDEIGLAELSLHNPLKVLHSELEVESCRFGFVGLSNWRLDASKMNRAIYVSCPDPDVNDLEITAKRILTSMANSQEQTVRFNESVIKGLADAYARLHEHVNKNEQYNHYFGLRDYYSLIKGIFQETIQTREDPFTCVRRQLSVNFDGIFDGSNYMWEQFCQFIKRNYLINRHAAPKFKSLLDQCLTQRTGRYLMLIAENESAIDYVERYIITNYYSHTVRTLIGSCFSGDLVSGTTYTEQYNHRILMDIIPYAERSTTLIMRRMGHIYDNLYDLFNQNFTVSAGKKFCRIPIGPLYHPRCLVNDEFYCIVFVQREELSKCDPPFLNRFEKHIIDMNSLFHPFQKTITSDLLVWLAELLSSNTNKNFPLLQHLFVNYNVDYIHNLVIDAFNQLNIVTDSESNHAHDILAYCKEKLLLASSFDLPLVLAWRSNNTENVHPLIDQYYNLHEHLSFSNILRQALSVDKGVIPDRIIYTYTQVHDMINYDNQENQIKEIKLGNFKTELELIKTIRLFYKSTKQTRLLIIRVDYHREQKHALFLKHILHNNREITSNHKIWIIFHLQRNLLNQVTNDVLFNDWNIIMIENLNEHKLIPREILINPFYVGLISHDQFRFTECTFDERIRRCFTKFRYIGSPRNDESRINEHLDRVLESITTTDPSIRSIVQSYLSILQANIQFDSEDWRQDLLTNEIIIGACHSVFSAIQQTISHYYDKYIFLLFSHLEKFSFLDTYLLIISMKPSDVRDSLEKIWHDSLTLSLKSIDRTMMNMNVMEIPLILGLHLPCARAEHDQLCQIRELLINNSQNYTSEYFDESDSTVNEFALNQLKKRSVYKNNWETIINQALLFEHYYHDQLLLLLDEVKLSQIPVSVVHTLLNSNPTRSRTDVLKHLLNNYAELIEILRMFEVCIELINGERIIVDMFEKQFIRMDTSNTANPHHNESHFYRLILHNEHFYLVAPQALASFDEAFECAGDPFIETSLMNLIELITSASSIQKVKNIEQLSTTYGRVVEGVLSLDNYTVNNLEKLRSFTSLVRCITTLVRQEQSLTVFKNACDYTNYDMNFQTCDDIHQFMKQLHIMINSNSKQITDNLPQDPLIKLETEFMKNWLVDHGNEYIDVLTSISKLDNSLWKYSARIFTVLDRKLELLDKIKKTNGQISQDDEEIEQFDQYLNALIDPTRKIEHLMVNRIHMHLILDVRQKRTIEDILQKDFIYLEDNIRRVIENQSQRSASLISLIAWLKYYTQYYALALNNDIQIEVMNHIDRVLTRDDSPFCSTLKLFIIKQLCQFFKVSLDGLCNIFVNRNCYWIRPMIAHSNAQQAQTMRRNLILPTPLFQGSDDFTQINKLLSQNYSNERLRALIIQCSSKQESSYSLFIWFIHHYSRFRLSDMPPDNRLKNLIEKELSETILSHFDLIGYRFLAGLCNNFNNSSYFSLDPNMTRNEIHQRMVALNIIALLLSTKAIGQTTHLSTFLFDRQLKMPENYTDHIQQSVCLPGLMTNNPVVTQMIDVRTRVEERFRTKKIGIRGRFMFRCSNECLWMFHFENCGRANDRSICPLCRKEIGAITEGVLIERQPPQIQMSIEEGFEFIDKYINEFNQKIVYGYHNTNTADQSNVGEKPNHLQLPISFRFTHMLTHTTLLMLHELDQLTNTTLPRREYFREHFEKDYELFGKQLADPEQSAVWLFKGINDMMGNLWRTQGSLDTPVDVIEFEKSIEEKIILPHIRSVADEINEYKAAYDKFISKEELDFEFDSYISELRENEQRFPLLNFFNITTIQTVNPLDEFLTKIQLIPQSHSMYPVTSFLMEKLQTYVNIQHLYPIVTFINYLIEKYNHRIKRNDASENTIAFYLNKDPIDATMSQLYRHFVHAWCKLDFLQVRFGCQTVKLEQNREPETFAQRTKFAAVLLNTSKDMSSIVLAGCLKTMGELQNEIVTFYQNEIYANTVKIPRTVPIQSIQPRHVLCLDKDDISKKLIANGFTINYQYGKSQEIIYDYEEIESTLRNLINGLPLIDVEHFRYLNYQFELYGENSSLINHVRARVKQEPLNSDERAKLQALIQNMKSDMVLNYLGSLDYAFTYLCNIDMSTDGNPPIIESFIKDHISSASCLNENVLRTPPFSKINLKHVIDLYELLEECAFDQILRHSIRSELSEELLPEDHRLSLIDKFIKMTYENKTIANCLHDANIWINILKRLMMRVLMNTGVSLDVALQIYLERTDLWPGHVTNMDIHTIDVSEEILLKHTYIILKGLERKQAKPSSIRDNIEHQTHDQNVQVQTSDEQIHQAKMWLTTTNETKMVPKQISETKKVGKKLRDK